MNEEVPGLTRATLHRARISRDARFDGKFFIAVLTTGVYCRPICPSPRSKKSHVRYYATAAAAAAAGYRPCRRCRPEVAPGSPAWLGPPAVVRRALRLIDEGALDGASVDELALRLGVGSRHLDRLFSTYVGVSPVAVAQTRRLHFAKQLLDETDLPVTRIAMTAGFGSLRRFNEAFRAAFRSTPRAARRRREGQDPGSAQEVSLSLSYRPPYDWENLAEFFRRRAIRGVERCDSNGYARTIRLGDRYARVLVAPLAGQYALRLQISGAQPKDLFEIATTARRVFDLSADPGPIVQMLSDDPVLAPLVARHPGLRLPGIWGTFECAVRAMLGQSMSIAAARALGDRLVERAGDRIGDAPGGLTHLFPSPERLADADLEGIGLPASKATGLRAVARAVLDGSLKLAAPADVLVRSLGSLPGASDWAAQYVAMHALAEPDAFPCGDRVVRRALAEARTLVPIVAMERRAQSWRPWRSYATLHLWQAEVDAGAAARGECATGT
jgi:AraC family transcriptional regulator, regulatory protein of adaptative response / DNA-3-methyladenine glycosylase II